MFENFDLSWFLTTPGMLTCLGCLLIIISIIIFISSLRGNRKNKSVNTNDEVGEQIPEVQENSQVQDANSGLGIDPTINQTVETTVSNTSASVEPVEVPPINVTNTPPVEPVNVTPVTPVEATPISVVPQSEQEPINITPIQPEPTPVMQTGMGEINVTPVTPVEATPISVAPQPEQESINITPIQPEPTPVMPPEMGEINVTPETPPAPEPVQAENQTLNNFTGINIEPVLQPVPPVNNMTESNPVNLPYGGANPAATITPLQEENKVIYGGADPLAGTGVIPQVSNDQVTELKKPEDIESL